MGDPVYKICSSVMLQEARGRGRFEGSADDARDGFIHLSAGHQVSGTLAKYFAGQRDLVLLAVDPNRLGESGSAGRPRAAASCSRISTGRSTSTMSSRSKTLVLQEDGTHRLPEGVAP